MALSLSGDLPDLTKPLTQSHWGHLAGGDMQVATEAEISGLTLKTSFFVGPECKRTRKAKLHACQLGTCIQPFIKDSESGGIEEQEQEVSA